MLKYPKQAITVKTLDKFNYGLYSSIGVNMLKYNHDSSSVFRLFAALCEDSFAILEDLNYQPKFSLRYIEFTSIDRISRYSIRSIPGINFSSYDYSNSVSNYIIGYSKYTGKEYTLELVDNENDFARHSMPCDLFLCSQVVHNHSNSYELPPYSKSPVGMYVQNSQVSIDVIGGISLFSKDSDSLVVIRIFGKDYANNDIQEDITILDQIEYVSSREYTFIDYMLLIGNNSTVTVRLFPYINGENISWNQMYVDREDFHDYRSTVSINQSNGSLVISKIKGIETEYPNIPEPVENIKLKTETNDEIITTYFIDADNKLVYTATDEVVNFTTIKKRFYCYPLIFPYRKNNQLEKIKTEYQSLKIEYIMDTINRECTFYIFPAERHNGIESLNIIINAISHRETYPSWNPFIMYFVGDEVAFNGELFTCIYDHTSDSNFESIYWRANVFAYSEDVMLDSYRENIETNRVVIPFNELFVGDAKECIVEFRTYGDNESILPIYLYELEVDYLCVKTLDDMTITWGDSASSEGEWLTGSEKSTANEYSEFYARGLGYGEGTYGGESTPDSIVDVRFGGSVIDSITSVFLYKLTNVGNLCINDSTIVNVFKTFVYDDDDQSITTSDTITALRGSDIEV